MEKRTRPRRYFPRAILTDTLRIATSDADMQPFEKQVVEVDIAPQFGQKGEEGVADVERGVAAHTPP